MRRAPALLAVLLAGCLAPGPLPAPGEAPAAAGFELTGSGCRELLVLVDVAREAAQAELPEGFAPADAGTFWGVPVPTGRALAGLVAQDCAEANLTTAGERTRALFHFGRLSLVVEPPAHGPQADLHVYDVALLAADVRILAAHRALGWTAQEGLVARQTERAPVGGPVVYEQVFEGPDFAYGARGTYDPTPTGDPSPLVVASHQANATLVLHLNVTVNPAGTGAWSASPGSALARMAGAERGPAAGVLWIAYDVRIATVP